MKILSYIFAVVGLAISAYGAYFEGMTGGTSHTIFGVSIVIFANILHRESCEKQNS